MRILILVTIIIFLGWSETPEEKRARVNKELESSLGSEIEALNKKMAALKKSGISKKKKIGDKYTPEHKETLVCDIPIDNMTDFLLNTAYQCNAIAKCEERARKTKEDLKSRGLYGGYSDKDMEMLLELKEFCFWASEQNGEYKTDIHESWTKELSAVEILCDVEVEEKNKLHDGKYFQKDKTLHLINYIDNWKRRDTLEVCYPMIWATYSGEVFGHEPEGCGH